MSPQELATLIQPIHKISRQRIYELIRDGRIKAEDEKILTSPTSIVKRWEITPESALVFVRELIDNQRKRRSPIDEAAANRIIETLETQKGV